MNTLVSHMTTEFGQRYKHDILIQKGYHVDANILNALHPASLEI
jgi:hypothetical protein